jgi:hypothetical protein
MSDSQFQRRILLRWQTCLLPLLEDSFASARILCATRNIRLGRAAATSYALSHTLLLEIHRELEGTISDEEFLDSLWHPGTLQARNWLRSRLELPPFPPEALRATKHGELLPPLSSEERRKLAEGAAMLADFLEKALLNLRQAFGLYHPLVAWCVQAQKAAGYTVRLLRVKEFHSDTNHFQV